MVNLLKSNFYRLFKKKEFYILLFIYPTLTILTQITRAMTVVQIQTGVQMYLSALNSWFVVTLAAIVISNFISEDFMLGAIFNSVTRGYKRIFVYTTYYIISISIMFIFMLLQAAVSFLIGTTLEGVGEINVKLILTSTFISLLFGMCYSALFLMISVIFRHTIFSMAVSAFLSFVLIALFPYISSDLNIALGGIWISNYYQSISTMSVQSIDIAISVILSVAYTTIFYVAGLIVFKKKDID